MIQLAFHDVVESVRDVGIARCIAFVAANRRRYRAMARAIDPDRSCRAAVWQRLAWAILTANATYESTIEALRRCAACGYGNDPLPPRALAGIPGMVPAKVDYLNVLPVGDGIFGLLRRPVWFGGDRRVPEEPWDAYRLRLRRDVVGLELTKASYAACMLYPLDADVACVDTWIQKIFTWTTRFRPLSLDEYRAIEAAVRVIARPAGVSTALCQWMLWDCVRGTTTDQRVFT